MRLNYDQSSIQPIWRLIDGPLSRHIIYVSRTPHEALDEALLQIRNLLETRKARRTSHRANRRQVLLKRALSPYQVRIRRYIRKITLIKSVIGSRGCSSQSCQALRVKIIGDTDLSRYRHVDLPTRLPSVVRRVLFNCELLRVMNTAPIESIHKIDWQSLVDQAEADLEAFDAWVSRQREKEGVVPV